MAAPLCEIIPSCCSFIRNQSDGMRGAVSVPLSEIIRNVGVTVAVPLFETIRCKGVDSLYCYQRSFGGRVSLLLFHNLKSFGRWLEVTVAFPLSEIIRRECR